MLPVMSSAPSGRLRALSAYSLRGLSPVSQKHTLNSSDHLALEFVFFRGQMQTHKTS